MSQEVSRCVRNIAQDAPGPDSAQRSKEGINVFWAPPLE